MKKTNLIIGLILILVLLPLKQNAMSITGGVFYGLRSINNSDIKDVYGNGNVYIPHLSIVVWKGLFFGASYEGGYSRTGKIGIYEEDASLDITGFDFYIGYEFKTKYVTPYIKVGGASFSYKQTISSSYIGDIKVNENKMTISFCGGIKFYPLKNVFLAAEVKYIPLKVKPYEDEVDLSGFRILGGIGFSF